MILAAACETKIVIPIDDKDPLLVVNAALESDGQVHRISVGESRNSEYKDIEADRVSVSINGVPVGVSLETEKAYWTYSDEGEVAHLRPFYEFQAAFKPGDEVLIEVEKAGIPSASAEFTVPNAPLILSADTSRVWKTVESEYDSVAGDFDFEMRPLLRDVKGEDNYYRLALGVRYDFRAYREDGTFDDFVRVYSSSDLDASHDPVIGEGFSSSSSSEGSLSDIFSVENTYLLFSDDSFRDGQYRMRFSAPSYLFRSFYFDEMGEYERVDYRASAIIKVYSISFLRYYYLRALANMENWGTETSFIIEPTTLPCNVRGGMGFAAVDAVATYEIKDVEKGSVTLIYTDPE